MEGAPRLSIVVALKDGAENLPALFGAVCSQPDLTEVILCSSGPPPPLPEGLEVVTVSLPKDTLIPNLWSEGIVRARGRAVGLTTAEFRPHPDWLAELYKADIGRWVGVGGAIDNDLNASLRSWAIFFLRYSAFSPPLAAGETHEIAADNAVYDRAQILEHPDLLEEGFWEPSFHRRFLAAGRRLALNPRLVVVHHGTVSARSFARQRYLHGCAYGLERAERSTVVGNLLLLAASPLIPPVLLGRIVRRNIGRQRYRAKLLPAFGWLTFFTAAWAAGEIAGYSAALAGRLSGTDRPQPGGQ